MNTTAIIEEVSNNLKIKSDQIKAVLELTEEGSTIPFIARYRKERTDNLDETQISSALELYKKTEDREKRRDYILEYLEKNEKLTPDLKKKLIKAETIQDLEDLYLPFKPRKKTLADKAIDLGLEPLAKLIKEKNLTKEQALKEAEAFITKGVSNAPAALEHAMNIIVQEVSDSAEVRKRVRFHLSKGSVISQVKRGKKDEGKKYTDYFEFEEKYIKIPAHRVMALLRGEKEKFLNLSIEPDITVEQLANTTMDLHFKKKGVLLGEASEESLKRHLLKTLSTELFNELFKKSEEKSVEFFSSNLQKILLFSPFGERPVIAIDPGIRTGCKAAILDKGGDFIEFLTINLNRNEKEAEKLLPLIKKYNIEGIAIGDGTFGRETYSIMQQLLKDTKIIIAFVDEDGASVYSAGKEAREEFPDLDATARGAISIGRRFKDPMAELVKIDPKSLGIGQYQHDITPALINERLKQTIEWAVNRVGVNINTAGYHILSYISGLDKAKAKEIVKLRRKIGSFSERNELKEVKGIGDKAFEQASGFLRIRGGKNILDSTGIHPESYTSVKKIAKHYGVTIEELTQKPSIIKVKELQKELKIDELSSIISELKQKGLDPRTEYKPVQYRDDIKSIDDLKVGMVLTGVVDNVVAFGAFVDLGIKDKGLVHISEVSNEYVKDINTVLSVGDEVNVKVLDIDMGRKRVGLSIKQV